MRNNIGRARSQRYKISKVLKGKFYQSRMLCPEKGSFRNRGEIKYFQITKSNGDPKVLQGKGKKKAYISKREKKTLFAYEMIGIQNIIKNL